MLQLLLAKLFDEHGHESKPKSEMEIQDFRSLGYYGPAALKEFNGVLEKALNFYQKYLPKAVSKKLPAKLTGDVLLEICKILAPLRLIASKREVIQSFYMKFAKGLYKWDLAQFFTPPTVTDFIVDVINPQFAEHLKDPACGSADFLTAAFHKRRDTDPKYADCIWGTDNSENAVQAAVLNMLLNGDGKSNISQADSLASVDKEYDQYNILLCNPPFGVRILEKSRSTLAKFDLGHEFEADGKGGFVKTAKLLDAQQAGLLFVEVCVAQAQPGGRIGIILPNGYLGNRSHRYIVFRNWLLRHCRVAAICSFPRFTFKTSGADVSASVMYLEKRAKPLKSVQQDKGYSISVQMIENVGWNLGDKKAAPRYVRNSEDGSFIVSTDGTRILESDFASMLSDIRTSKAAKDFPWLTQGIAGLSNQSGGWSIPALDVLSDSDLTLDPKRHCRKFRTLQKTLIKQTHVKLGDVVDFIPERKSAAGANVKKLMKSLYKYAELQDIGHGDHASVNLRGWELPDRAKHFAETGDIYIGKIWGSVSKWFLAPNDSAGLVVTNGCYRLRLKKGKEAYLPDLAAFFCTEAYSVQMRAMARGSDGLAEISEDDAASIVVPCLTAKAREEVLPFIAALQSGVPAIKAKVGMLMGSKLIDYPDPSRRPSHVVLV